MPENTARTRGWYFRLALRLLVAAVVLGWLGHYVYTRLTVMPPLAVKDYGRALMRSTPRAPGDATGELRAIFTRLCVDVPFAEPAAPAGMQWDWSAELMHGRRQGWPETLDFSDAANGPWDLAARPHLQAIVTHLESPATRVAIGELRALRGRPFVAQTWADLIDEGRSDVVRLADLRRVVHLLVSDARYQFSVHGDVVEAWEDLKTGLWLADAISSEDISAVLTAIACSGACLAELQHMLIDADVGAELDEDMNSAVRRGPRFADRWLGALAGEQRTIQAIVDVVFTRDAVGNGWFVPARGAEFAAMHADPMRPRAITVNPLWNLGACLYNDRRTVESKMDRMFARARLLHLQPYRAATAELDRPREQFGLSHCDGAPIYYFTPYLEHFFWLLTRHSALRDADLVALALSRFHNKNGSYPTGLEEMVPTCIESLPLDPFGTATFGYRRSADDRYVLWSVGSDGIDEAGVGEVDPRNSGMPGDIVYTRPRPASNYKSRLVPPPPRRMPASSSVSPSAGDFFGD